MNRTGVPTDTQRVVLGAVILGTVLRDSFKKRTWRLPRRFGHAPNRQATGAWTEVRTKA
jgi:hypothetical protein